MFSKLLFSISFSRLLCSHEHKTLSAVSFSFASDANYDAFSLMRLERVFKDMHTHTNSLSLIQTHIHPPTHTYKIAVVPSNYGSGEPLISWRTVSVSHHSVFVSPLLLPCGKTQLFPHLPGSQVHSIRWNSRQTARMEGWVKLKITPRIITHWLNTCINNVKYANKSKIQITAPVKLDHCLHIQAQ